MRSKSFHPPCRHEAKDIFLRAEDPPTVRGRNAAEQNITIRNECEAAAIAVCEICVHFDWCKETVLPDVGSNYYGVVAGVGFRGGL